MPCQITSVAAAAEPQVTHILSDTKQDHSEAFSKETTRFYFCEGEHQVSPWCLLSYPPLVDISLTLSSHLPSHGAISGH